MFMPNRSIGNSVTEYGREISSQGPIGNWLHFYYSFSFASCFLIYHAFIGDRVIEYGN